MIRVNVGCGQTPTPGWVNIDNSPSVRLATLPFLWPLLPPNQRSFARTAGEQGVRYGVATKLPLPNESAEVIYSSHMMEHLDRAEARAFLKEAYRVLGSGGRIRLALPDIRRMALAYLEHGDADAFIHATHMGTDRARSAFDWIRHIAFGPRHHLWMYDAESLKQQVLLAGFQDPVELPPGKSNIPGPGPLDLRERDSESVYVEAVKP